MAVGGSRRRVPSTKIKKTIARKDPPTTTTNSGKDGRPQAGPGPPVSISTAIKAFLSARFCSAVWSHISDCDETYNYWEPSHFLMYMKGFQTWEYSPEYGLRSYTYLLFHLLPALLYDQLVQPSRVLVFYFVRCILGLMCALCECYFYVCVCKEFGPQVGRLLLTFLLFSPGMFISSTAFLPSSFSMYMVMVSMGAWYGKQYELAVFATALSALLSWPFAALASSFIAIDMLLLKKMHFTFIKWSLFSALLILGPMVKTDTELFGKLVVAPLNIVLYNVFTKHGPSLYGVEPPSFYFVNGFLNFNIIFLMAISTPMLVFIKLRVTTPNLKVPLRFWLLIGPFYLWMLVFTAQPHKEERFLFPVYPLICLCGAISVSTLQTIFSVVVPTRREWISSGHIVGALAIGVSALLGISRILALYKGYHAPMDVYMQLNELHASGKVPEGVTMNVCVGKEWHRFPSSFFLPADNWNLKFLQSEFKGQLPAEYSNVPDGASIIHAHFNDQNREERSRYFELRKCHFIIDLDLGKETPLEPNYSQQKVNWTVRFSKPFLNAERSHKLFRAFYIPFLYDKYCVHGSYNLLQSTRLILRE